MWVTFPPVVEVTSLLRRGKKGGQEKMAREQKGGGWFRARRLSPPVSARCTAYLGRLWLLLRPRSLLPVKVCSEKPIKVVYTLGLYIYIIHIP